VFFSNEEYVSDAIQYVELLPLNCTISPELTAISAPVVLDDIFVHSPPFLLYFIVKGDASFAAVHFITPSDLISNVNGTDTNLGL
jgi:hypothetical protein